MSVLGILVRDNLVGGKEGCKKTAEGWRLMCAVCMCVCVSVFGSVCLGSLAWRQCQQNQSPSPHAVAERIACLNGICGGCLVHSCHMHVMFAHMIAFCQDAIHDEPTQVLNLLQLQLFVLKLHMFPF